MKRMKRTLLLRQAHDVALGFHFCKFLSLSQLAQSRLMSKLQRMPFSRKGLNSVHDKGEYQFLPFHYQLLIDVCHSAMSSNHIRMFLFREPP